ncbi:MULTISPECIES: hypothetical protein [Streptomyces]|uniref:hypothetical protein n=1 Tax=Streptomyces TaxID=1883 RepID=UPI000575719E|nr:MULTISPECIES: hypothetical protein [Streptomyces]
MSRLVIGRRTEPGFPPYLRLVHLARAGHVPPVPPAPRSSTHQRSGRLIAPQVQLSLPGGHAVAAIAGHQAPTRAW